MKIQAAKVNVSLVVTYLDTNGDSIYTAEPVYVWLEPGQKLEYIVPDPIEIEVKTL